RTPVSDIVRELGLPQSGRWRLFDVVLSFEPNDYDVHLGDARVQAYGYVGGYEFNPLAIYVREYNSERPVAIDFAYNPNYLNHDNVADLRRCFELVIDLYLADQDAPVGSIDITAPDERALLQKEEILASTLAHQETASVVSLVEAQVLLRPGSVAVEGGGEGLSYGALWSRSGTLAARLRGLGVGPDRVVGLCLDRAVGTVVSVLAVWRAGGAYVALDPTYPDARLDYLIRDSGAVAVLSRGGDAARIEGLLAADPGSRRVAVLDLDRFDDNDAGPLSALPDPPHPDALAYVIYTSGSTGQPKPVAVSHAGLLNHTRWLNGRYGLGPHDRVVLKTPLSFDASVWELISPLGSGATLVVAPTSVPGDVAALARLLADEAIAVVQVVPSLLAALLECPELDAARALRLVFCGGAALPPALARRFRERLPGVSLHNLYGPTEATIDATAWSCGAADAVGPGSSVPIGCV